MLRVVVWYFREERFAPAPLAGLVYRIVEQPVMPHRSRVDVCLVRYCNAPPARQDGRRPLAIARKTERDISSLRSTIEWLRATNQMLETDVEVNPDLEITGIQKTLDGSFPILF